MLEKKELERQQAIQKQNSIQTEEEYQFEKSFPLSPEYNVNLQLEAYNYDYYKIEDKIDIEIHNFLYGNLYNSTSIF